MVYLTRRNMLAASLTTAASCVFETAGAAVKGENKTAQTKTAQTSAPPENKFLVTPQSPIIGGYAVPVGIRITPASLKDSRPTSITATLQWNGAAIADFTVGKLALALSEREQDVKFATRIKIPATTKGQLSVEVTADEGKTLIGHQSVDLEISQCSNCLPLDHGQLVLETQPVQFISSTAVAVKSYVPKPVPTSRVLGRIDCVFNRPSDPPLAPPLEPLPAYQVIGVKVRNAGLLADEVFLAVDFMPSTSGLLEMLWTYNNGGRNTGLQACAYLTQTS